MTQSTLQYQLAYKVHPGDGPFLLLLHGFISSSAQWLDNLQALGKVCRPVTVDLWGHGDSPAPEDLHYYSPAAYGRQFNAIREALGAQKWFVCGYSLGAGLTIRYTYDYADHVIGHIFTNSNSALADEAQIREWQTTALKGSENIRQGGLAAIEKIPVHPRRARTLPTHIYNALMKDAAKFSPTGVANTLLGTNPNTCIRDIASLNPRPVLLCAGDKERRFRTNKLWAVENMANLTCVSFDAGHGVNMEAAGGFNMAVTQFIQSLT
ncbi:MAG: alpha/beta fold hydrolase [Pseudomonadales bacterium]|jgi:pimeloyl-ACP methyl ester carboxylesterase|nr:alpha/beta fold hydrolase [Pseudomonadales bacterium]